MVAIILLLAIFAFTNYNIANSLNYQPNVPEYDLINYLSENNLTYGYGDYWDSDIITYLSNGKVAVRSAWICTDGIRPYKLISNDNWYKEGSYEYFLLVNHNYQYQIDASEVLTKTSPPAMTYQYKKYTIYVYNNSLSEHSILLFDR
jgi:hypothetical protein